MKPFMNADFLLPDSCSQRLYHDYAAQMPIIDYHCHIDPREIYEDKVFSSLSEVWLGGDHYKWRAMRSNGVPERFATGNATPREKFDAWCAAVPHTLRNPLYHWSHLELRRYFDIDLIINEANAPKIWERANAKLAYEACDRRFSKDKLGADSRADLMRLLF